MHIPTKTPPRLTKRFLQLGRQSAICTHGLFYGYMIEEEEKEEDEEGEEDDDDDHDDDE